MKRNDFLDEIERQLSNFSRQAAALAEVQALPLPPISDAVPELPVPNQHARWIPRHRRFGQGHWFATLAGALLAGLALVWFGISYLHLNFAGRNELTDSQAIRAVVERIIGAESNGDPNAKNKRSSATGPGQFLNETWLDLIRTYRPDLAKSHSDSEILDLRRDPVLAREITTRFVEQNAALLRQRNLPVTAGTVYLAHFAGGAGAVAILLAPENAEAALVMANADATGRTNREQIVKANPFLKRFTVADIKAWADRKMRSFSTGRIFAADAIK